MKWLLTLFLTGLVLRLLLLRGIPGADPYFHARMALLILRQEGIPSWDPVSYGGRPYSYPPLSHILLAEFTTVFPVEYPLALLPTIYGALAFLGIYLRTKNIYLSTLYAFTPLLILRTANYFRPDGFFLFLIPILVHYPKLDPFHFLTPLFHLPSALFSSAVTSYYRRSPRPLLYSLIGASLFFLLVGVSPLHYFSPLALGSAEMGRPSFLEVIHYFGLLSLFLPFANMFSWILLMMGAFSRRFLVLTLPVVALELNRAVRERERVIPVLMAIYLPALWIIFLLSPSSPTLPPSCVPKSTVLAPWDLGHAINYYGGVSVADGYFEALPPGGEERARDSLQALHPDCSVLDVMAKYGADYLLTRDPSRVRDCMEVVCSSNGYYLLRRAPRSPA